jgi:S1-C subfamily serine protease
VQIFNSSYAIDAESKRSGGTVVSQQRSSGSGIVVSSDGFIFTDAHLVQGARRPSARLNNNASGSSTHLQDAQHWRGEQKLTRFPCSSAHQGPSVSRI